MSATATEGASMMAMASKRVRSAKWDDAETTLLAKLKREAFLRGEEGRHVWQDISQTISGRSAKQCRRRWETLVKVYTHVQDYCTQTGQNHEELDDEELASMKLETAYRREWYMIVQEVCSERKRRRICDRGSAVMLSKGISTGVMKTLPNIHPDASTDSPDHEELDDEELASMKLMTAFRRDWYVSVHDIKMTSQGKRLRNCDRLAAATVSKGSSTPVMETLPPTRPATTAGPVDTSPDSDSENNAVYQFREFLNSENCLRQSEEISIGRLASNCPRRERKKPLLEWVGEELKRNMVELDVTLYLNS